MPSGIYKKTEEHKRKISESEKGKILSEETKRKIGNANRGKIRTEETRKKISESLKNKKGRKLSEETKQKLSKINKGKIPQCVGWNKGLPKEKQPRFGKKHTEETKRKISKALMDNKSWLGKKHSKKTRQKISNALKGKNAYKRTEETKRKMSEVHTGHKVTEKTRKKLSKMFKGSNGSNWQGGKSFEPYGLEFNNDLKEVIRNRDRRKCKLCEKTELEENKKLCVHHIDYNKKNSNPNNLISLCYKCHGKTNNNRNYWIEYFKSCEMF